MKKPVATVVGILFEVLFAAGTMVIGFLAAALIFGA